MDRFPIITVDQSQEMTDQARSPVHDSYEPAGGRAIRTIDIIQVLRFLAALLVVVYHVQPKVGTEVGDFKSIFAFVQRGNSGVDIFFVLSGFIITLTVLRNSKFDISNFALNRIFRIYPTYWLFLSAAIVLGFISYKFTGYSGTYEAVNLRSLTVSFLLLPTYEQIYPVAWTLTLEVTFYLIFCLSYRVGGLRGVIVSLLTWYMVNLFASAYMFSNDDPFIWFFHSIVLEFLYGVLIASLWVNNRIRWPGTVFVLGALAYVGVVTGAFERFDVGREIKWGLPAALLIYGAVGLPWKAPRFAVLAGDSSYILYLIHPLIITTIKVLGLRLFGIDTFQSNGAAILIIVVSVTLAMLMTHWIEFPYINWYKGLIGRKAGHGRLEEAKVK